MSTSAIPCQDFRLVLHDSLSDGYELSQVLLAKAGRDGKLQLLTSGWERALGYSREELNRATLGQLMWSDRGKAAAAVAAILDELVMTAVDVRLRCRDGAAKGFRLHRRYDRRERMVYMIGEETAAQTAAIVPYRAERRAARR